MLKKQTRRQTIKYRIRKKITGSAERPRLSVFRSNKQIYAQIINDENGVTLVSSSSSEKDFKGTKAPKSELAKMVGKNLAEKAKQAGITNVVFDRGGYLYHGRVKSLADGAREGGIVF